MPRRTYLTPDWCAIDCIVLPDIVVYEAGQAKENNPEAVENTTNAATLKKTRFVNEEIIVTICMTDF